MHELSLAQEMIDALVKAAGRENAQRVERVVVAIGTYSGVEHEAFAFAFPFAAENTMVQGAELVIETIPARAVCQACRAESDPGPAALFCPRCGSDEVRLEGGRDFLIRSVDLEISGSDED